MIKIEKIENKKVYDITIEKNSNFFANNILVHNCGEILEVSKPDEIANCNLASMVLPKYVINGKFDFERLREVSYKAIINLNKVIDHNFYPTPETKKSNFRHRPLGLGVAGLADVFALMDMSFDSPEAKELNKKIFETIYFGALQASCDLAKIEGSYETFEGSLTSKGILQFDLWKNRSVKSVNSKLEIVVQDDVQLSGMWDFNSLKEDIKKYGLRNSLLTALMPTASCHTIDLKIKTDKGDLSYKEILEMNGINWQEIENSDEQRWITFTKEKPKVMTYNKEFVECDKIFYNGHHETFLIEMEDGSTFEATANHKYLVNRDGREVWVRVDELKIDDDIVSIQ